MSCVCRGKCHSTGVARQRERDPPTWFYVERLVQLRQHKGAWPPAKQKHAWDAGVCAGAMPSRIAAKGAPLVYNVRGAAKGIESLMCLVLAQLKARCGTSNSYLFRRHARDKAARVCRLAEMALCGFAVPDTPSGEYSKERWKCGSAKAAWAALVGGPERRKIVL